MQDAFGWDVDRYLFLGGYPGSAGLIQDQERWRHYIIGSLIETAVSRDILLMRRVDKPAHLLLDRMWEHPATLFWPLLGNRFDAIIPPDLSHLQFLAFLRWRWEQGPFSVAFDLVAEVVGVVVLGLLLRKMGVIRKHSGRYGHLKSLERS